MWYNFNGKRKAMSKGAHFPMNHTAVLLKPIDYFPLMSFYKSQNVSPIPRFTRPTEECMKSYAAVKIGAKIVASAGVFVTNIICGDKTLKAAYVSSYACMAETVDIINALAARIKDMLEKSGADILTCEDCALAPVLGVESKAYKNVFTVSREKLCAGDQSGEIKNVFAFVELKVIMDEDYSDLCATYANGVHFDIPDKLLRLSLCTDGLRPVIVKNSRGKVTALMLLTPNGEVCEIHAACPDDVPDIFKAYMIMHGLDTLLVSVVPGDAQMCKVISESGIDEKQISTTFYKGNEKDSIYLPQLI